MSYMFHVSPYLVRPARFQNTFHQRGISVAFQHPVVCNCRFPLVGVRREHVHAQTVLGVTYYVAFYAPLVLNEVAPHQRVVAAVRRFVKELYSERRLCVGCLCRHKQSAGIFINAVNKSYGGVVRVVVGVVTQVPCYSVHQCAVIVAASRMHHHSSGFVDNHQLVVLIDYVQGDVLRLNGIVIVRTVKHQRHHVVGTHLVVALNRAVVNMYETGVGSLLYAVSA